MSYKEIMWAYKEGFLTKEEVEEILKIMLDKQFYLNYNIITKGEGNKMKEIIGWIICLITIITWFVYYSWLIIKQK